MRSISIYFLSVVLTLSVYGCFGSRERGEKVDSGLDGADVAVETDGTGGINKDNDTGMNDAPCAPNCPDLDWVTILGGTFMMGSAEGVGDHDEHPQHEVTVQTFKMSKTEVTVAQYGICVDAGICREPIGGNDWENWENRSESGRGNHPVNPVDWHQAREFAEWLGGRLPSEAEWEYASRSGGRDIIYPWGDEDATCERAVNSTDENGDYCGNGRTMEVCSRPLGNTTQGLCDMAGNVFEWVEDDWHYSYSGAPSNGQAWIDNPRSDRRVFRGGSWYLDPGRCRCAARYGLNPKDRDDDVGFRIVLDLK
jgi:formylglycine-generating enzyme required for sulfatase activity